MSSVVVFDLDKVLLGGDASTLFLHGRLSSSPGRLLPLLLAAPIYLYHWRRVQKELPWRNGPDVPGGQPGPNGPQNWGGQPGPASPQNWGGQPNPPQNWGGQPGAGSPPVPGGPPAP